VITSCCILHNYGDVFVSEKHFKNTSIFSAKALRTKLVTWVINLSLFNIFSQYGFIAYETDEAKNLFFHTSEIEDDTLSIKVGVHYKKC
jgi:hypothetical protein